MQVTAFGWFFLPVLLAVALWARPWLPGLLLGSAVFQAAAVVNVPVGTGYFGVSPYVASAAVAGLVMLWRWLGPDKSAISPPAHLRTPALWLLIYAAVAVIGSFVLPHVFAGLPVQPPLDPKGYGLTELPPLKWGISNLAQSFNLCLHVLTALFLWQAMLRADWTTRNTIIAFTLACSIAVLAGLHDRIALWNNWQRAASFWMSNAGYAQVDLADVRWANPDFATQGGEQVLTYYRISSPFSEPSYGSAFLAALLSGITTLTLFAHKKIIWGILSIIFVLAGLINTLGATGILAAAASLLIIFVWGSAHLIKINIAREHHRLNTAFLALATILTTSVIVVVFAASQNEKFSASIKITLVDRFSSFKDDARYLSDIRGLKIAAETTGLGAGLGSNRTSGFFSGLLSNTGFAGTIAFLTMVSTLAMRYMSCRKLMTSQYFAGSAMGAALLAAFLGIPDLNLPFLWAFIFLAFALCPAQSVIHTPPGHA